MHNSLSPVLRVFPQAAVALAAALLLTGCVAFPMPSAGSTTSTERGQAAVDGENSPAAEPGGQPEATNAPSSAPHILTRDGDDAGVEEADAKDDTRVNAGTIELGIGDRVFTYVADSCVISDEYVLVSGEGTEVGTGVASEVGIFSEPAELLHERTGTWQAGGVVSVRNANEEFVSDGRMESVGGHRLPSMFTYRIDGNSIKYALAWYSGSAKVPAGYIKVTCR